MGLFASKSALPKFDGHFTASITTKQVPTGHKCTYSVESSDLSKVTKFVGQAPNFVKFEVDLVSNDIFLLKDDVRTKVGTDGDISQLNKAIEQILSNIRLQLDGKTFEPSADLEYTIRVASTSLDAGLFYEFDQKEQLMHKVTGTDLSPVTFAVDSTGAMSMLQYACSSEPVEPTLVAAGTDGDHARNLPTIHAMTKALELVLHPVKTVETAVETAVENAVETVVEEIKKDVAPAAV